MQHRFFDSIWEAVSHAHQSYRITLVEDSLPKIPEALYEPGLETWTEHLVNVTKSLVHVSPDEPKFSGRENLIDDAGEELWLAGQEAMVAFRQHSGAETKAIIMNGLTRLTEEIIEYDNAVMVSPRVHYHAARILINLITPFAPSFAEECWVLLHYGRQSLLKIHPNAISMEHEWEEEQKDDIDDDSSEPRSLEDIESRLNDREGQDGYTNLPRRWYPETLASLFELAPPMPASSETLHLLKQRVASRRREKLRNEQMDEED
ncbi:MAG: hypothetical protein Q9169_008285 [Polycauliona sp. 2 TL-2023]